MEKFSSTKIAIQSTKKFIADNDIEPFDIFNFTEDYKHKKEIFDYLQKYIVVIFITEFDEIAKNILDIHTNKKSNISKKRKKKTNKQIWKKVNNDYFTNDVYKQYQSYRENRNNVAHPIKTFSLTWIQYINVKISTDLTKEFDIVDIGEMMLQLVDKTAKNMTQA